MSERRTLMLGTALAIVLPALALAAFQVTVRFQADVDLRIREPLKQYADLLDTGMGVALWTQDVPMAVKLVEAVMKNPDVVLVTVRDEMGRTFVTSGKEDERQGASDLLRDVRQIHMYDRALGEVEVLLSTTRVRVAVLEVLAGQGLALLVQVSLTFTLIWVFLSRRMIRPLRRLQQEVSLIARGDLERPLPLGQGGEIGRLTAGLDTMRKDLSTLIAGRKSDGDRLRAQTAQLRTLLDTLPDLVWLKSGDGVYLACNQRFELMFGAPESEILGKTDYDFVSREQADFFRYNDRRALMAGVPTTNEEEVTFASDGHKELLETVKTPIRSPDGAVYGVLGIGRDISGRRKAEAEKIRLQAQLLQAQKLESLGLLAGGVAHDMNNILASILVLASAYRKKYPEDGPAFRAFDTITRAADRGGKLVRQLLTFSRQNPTEDRDIDVNALISEHVDLLKQTTAASVTFETSLDPGPLVVRGDASALGNALMNLSVNAIDAMPRGGRLAFRTRHRPDSQIEIRISDNGTGMPEEVLQKAFDPFFTTKPMGKGTGLGLSLVYATVRAHRGNVEIESHPGQGTEVTLLLPSVGGSAGQKAPSDRGPARSSRPLKILLVDDDDLIRETLKEILDFGGHQVSEAASGEASLTLLGTDGTFDVVLLDMNMPGLGGAETLPQIRERFPNLPVLLCTGRADSKAQDLTQRFAKVALLAKPFDQETLEAALRQFLSGDGSGQAD